jgi:hypothetical protein
MVDISLHGDMLMRDITARNAFLINNTHSDAAGSRASNVSFRGETSAGTIHTLAQITAQHDGSVLDEKAKVIVSINDGAVANTVVEVVSIDSGKTVGLTGALNVTGAATFTAQSVHDGGIDVNGTGDVSDMLTLSKASGTGLAVTADATVGGTVAVTGVATFSAQSVHDGGIDVNGAGDVSDTLSLSKASGTGLVVVADATIGGTAAVTGVATFTAQSVHDGGIDVNGAGDVSDTLTLSKATGTGLAVTADATVGGTVAVTGVATFTAQSVHDGGIDVNGAGDVSDTLTLSKATGTGLSVTSNALVGGNLTVEGNLVVTGSSTSVSTTTVEIEDKNIELGKVSTPTDTTADGGGVTLKGATDKTFQWSQSNNSWDLSEHVNAASGKEYRVDNVRVLDATSVMLDSAGAAGTVYLGPDADGSWRITVVAGDLVHQKKESGTWVTKQAIVA